MLRSAMGYLAAADATAMAAETQAQCLQALEQINSMGTAARASILAAFTSGQGYSRRCGLQPEGVADQPDRDHQGRRGGLYRVGPPGRRASAGRGGAGGRGDCRSRSPGRSVPGRTSCPGTAGRRRTRSWSPRRRAGMDVRDLAGLAAEIYARSLPEDPGKDRDQGFEDRSVKLETTFDGAGVLSGDLTPGVRGGGDRGAGRAVGPGRRGGHPQPGPAVPRCAAARRCSGWSPPGCCPSGPGSR